ncbi:MAG: dipeptide/oligopeptide/nickel ABC transporter ATP-binding protein, partial [Nonomuraea sp.]|nr:dipeptide/oligopeptide/nickel ABC transporter ATP-binding protein [Nonomuraea sp.]
LLAAVPDADPRHGQPNGPRVRGELPSPIDPPSGCRFRTRCGLASDLCATTEPLPRPVTATHQVACHHPLRPPRPAAASLKGASRS